MDIVLTTGLRIQTIGQPAFGITVRTCHAVEPFSLATHGSGAEFASPFVRTSGLSPPRTTAMTRCDCTWWSPTGMW